MARSSKKPSNNFLKWLLIGAAVALISVFLYPSQQSNPLKNPSSSSDQASKSESSQSEHVYLELRVPVSRDDPTQHELFVFTRPNHLWNSVSELCVRLHAAGSGHPSWPWPSLQALLQTVHAEAIKAMGSAVAAEAEQAYLRSVQEKNLMQQELGISDGRKLSIPIIWNEARGALRMRAAHFNELHGFQTGEPIAHIIESVMLSLSFLTLKQPEGTIQWIAASIPKFFGMVSNSSFGSRSSGRKVFVDVGSRNAEFFTILNGLTMFDGFEWWLIECNPRRREYLQTIVSKFAATTKVQFLPMAAWTENTTLSFHIDDDVAESDHGSSLFSDHAMVHADGMKSEVAALDYSAFLRSHFVEEDLVLSRMDIEGAEYSVIGALLESGSAFLLDYLDVEWHSRLAPSLHKFEELDSLYESRLRDGGVTVDSGNFYHEVKCSSKGGNTKCTQKKK